MHISGRSNRRRFYFWWGPTCGGRQAVPRRRTARSGHGGQEGARKGAGVAAIKRRSRSVTVQKRHNRTCQDLGSRHRRETGGGEELDCTDERRQSVHAPASVQRWLNLQPLCGTDQSHRTSSASRARAWTLGLDPHLITSTNRPAISGSGFPRCMHAVPCSHDRPRR